MCKIIRTFAQRNNIDSMKKYLELEEFFDNSG